MEIKELREIAENTTLIPAPIAVSAPADPNKTAQHAFTTLEEPTRSTACNIPEQRFDSDIPYTLGKVNSHFSANISANKAVPYARP